MEVIVNGNNDLNRSTFKNYVIDTLRHRRHTTCRHLSGDVSNWMTERLPYRETLFCSGRQDLLRWTKGQVSSSGKFSHQSNGKDFGKIEREKKCVPLSGDMTNVWFSEGCDSTFEILFDLCGSEIGPEGKASVFPYQAVVVIYCFLFTLNLEGKWTVQKKNLIIQTSEFIRFVTPDNKYRVEYLNAEGGFWRAETGRPLRVPQTAEPVYLYYSHCLLSNLLLLTIPVK